MRLTGYRFFPVGGGSQELMAAYRLPASQDGGRIHLTCRAARLLYRAAGVSGARERR